MTKKIEEKQIEEDIANIRSYYGVLFLCIVTLSAFGIISFIWGR